ncbi:hypothetical protein ACJX0J_020444 [Zea mays]
MSEHTLWKMNSFFQVYFPYLMFTHFVYGPSLIIAVNSKTLDIYFAYISHLRKIIYVFLHTSIVTICYKYLSKMRITKYHNTKLFHQQITSNEDILKIILICLIWLTDNIGHDI